MSTDMRPPAPGEGPSVSRTTLVPGERLLGMAPIGVRWMATVNERGRIKPEGNCPASEFCLTHVWRQRGWMEVV